MKLDGPFGYKQLAGNLLVGEVVEQQVKDLAFTAADLDYGIERLGARQLGQNRLHKAGKQVTRYPISALCNLGGGAPQLASHLLIHQQAFDAQAKQRIGQRVFQLRQQDEE